MISKIKDLHARLIGSSETTPLAARIFHEVCMLTIISIAISIIFNLIIAIPYVTLLLGAAMLMVLVLFVASRYYGKLALSTITFIVAMNLAISINYFLNGGVQGSNLLLFILVLFFTFSVTPTQQHRFWITINLLIISSLIAIEYFFSDKVKITYLNKHDLAIDTFFTYVVVVILIAVVTGYVLNSYRQQRDQALNISEELKAANESKTKLLSLLSHDIRSPLNSIQHYLELLLDYELDDQEQLHMKQTLLRETKNTQMMLANLLAWTKSQMLAGLKANCIAINLAEVVNEAIQALRAAASAKLISIKLAVNSEVIIFADRDMFMLIVRNLVNNAIKFTHQGGEILISSEERGNAHALIVQDNGIGIKDHQKEQLFELSAGSTYGTKNEKGVGLGLLLCKEFAEIQGGKISFISDYGKGTKFYLSIPSLSRT